MTVGEAQELFSGLYRGNFLTGLNETLERFYNQARWPELLEEVVLVANEDRNVVLSYRHASIIGISVGGAPRDLRSLAIEYVTSGPGHLNEESFIGTYLVDLGDFATDRDPPTEGVLKLGSNAADDGDRVRIFGASDTGTIYTSGAEGEQVDLASPSALTTQEFSSISEITKPVVDYPIQVYHVGDSDVLISTLMPNETKPRRRRYKLVEDVDDDCVIRALVKRRFIPVSKATDVVRPSNQGALKLGISAVTFENTDDLERAAEYWSQAYSALANEAGQGRGSAQQAFHINPNGMGIGKVRSLY